MLKAYTVFPDGYRHEHAELVFHNSASEAKQLAWKRPHGEFHCDWIGLRVHRAKSADSLAAGLVEPFVCSDDAMFRAAGWRSEDCDECACCGLTDFSFGDNEQWAVCPECDQCAECGHDVECSTSTP